MGGVKVNETTYESLVSYTKELKEMKEGSNPDAAGVHNILQMLASTVDYQFA